MDVLLDRKGRLAGVIGFKLIFKLNMRPIFSAMRWILAVAKFHLSESWPIPFFASVNLDLIILETRWTDGESWPYEFLYEVNRGEDLRRGGSRWSLTAAQVYEVIYIRLSGDIIANENNQYNSNSLHRTYTKIIIIINNTPTAFDEIERFFGLLIAWTLHCGLDFHWQDHNPFSEKKKKKKGRPTFFERFL